MFCQENISQKVKLVVKKGAAAHATAFFCILERMKGIEPSYQAWEARILPLNYTRMNFYLFILPVFMRFVKVFEEFS